MDAYFFPGQGSQQVGMGAQLFRAFPELTEAANTILGYSLDSLCAQGPLTKLSQTQFTQPALYVVNALAYREHLENGGSPPSFALGHSLGEYNALEAAGVFTFEDGLRLVQKRGELMSQAAAGSMAAVIGISPTRVKEILLNENLSAIDLANLNSNSQTIISGLQSDIKAAQAVFERASATYVVLNVSGAFHSRYMASAKGAFREFAQNRVFFQSKFPVIANITALPYQNDQVVNTLCDQLTNTVRWHESVEYVLSQGVTDVKEFGPGEVLSKLYRTIRSQFIQKPATATTLIPKPLSAKEQVEVWNAQYPIGTTVRANGYQEVFKTKSAASLLFSSRPVVYLNGFNGYFPLEDINAVNSVQ